MARKGSKIEPRCVVVDTKKGGVEIDFTEGSPLDTGFIPLWDILLIGAIEMQGKTKAGSQRTVQWLGRELLAHALGMKALDIKSWAVRFGAAEPEEKNPAKKAAKKPAAKKTAKKAPAKKAAKKAPAKKAAKKAPAKKPVAKRK